MKSKSDKKQKKSGGILSVLGTILAYLLTTIVFIFIALYLIMMLLCKGPSISARETFVVTMLETGNMKFVVSWYLTEDEILAITNREADTPIATPESNDTSLVTVSTSDNLAVENTSPEMELINSLDDPDGDGIILVDITGRTFGAKLLVVRDPSKVAIASCYPFSSMEMEKNGYTVGEYAELNHALAATNAGEFETPSGINWGGRPIGVVVKNGNVEFAEPTYGDVFVGFNKDNVLVIQAVGTMSPDSFNYFVWSNGIRDGASFKDISYGDNNHFTMLIMNGEPVDLGSRGTGANPRTAIGQCSDGTVLILVTDGRGSSGHLGATGQDLINVMLQYGAVNAANLDGGSSSSLYFDGRYEMTSSYLPNSDSSRRLPTAIIVNK